MPSLSARAMRSSTLETKLNSRTSGLSAEVPADMAIAINQWIPKKRAVHIMITRADQVGILRDLMYILAATLGSGAVTTDLMCSVDTFPKRDPSCAVLTYPLT